jgi:hypothetical protein
MMLIEGSDMYNTLFTFYLFIYLVIFLYTYTGL